MFIIVDICVFILQLFGQDTNSGFQEKTSTLCKCLITCCTTLELTLSSACLHSGLVNGCFHWSITDKAKSLVTQVWSLRSLLPVKTGQKTNRQHGRLTCTECVLEDDWLRSCMQKSAWKKQALFGTYSLTVMTPKKPQQWLQVVGHAGLFIWPLCADLILVNPQ